MPKIILPLLLSLPLPALGGLWDTTCEIVHELHGLTCEGVSAPEIIYVDEPEFTRAEYTGGNSIQVSGALEGINHDWMVVHEMTHYLFTALDVLPIPSHKYIVCPSEAVAFGVSNEYLRQEGYGSQTIEWLEKYPYCEWMASD